MKRILALILAFVMVFTFLSCGKKDEPAADDNTDNTVEDGTAGDGTVGGGTVQDTTTDDDTTSNTPAAGDTLGTTLLGVFKATAEANPDMTAEEIAQQKALMDQMPEPELSAEERLAVLEEALEMILSGVTE